MGFTLSFSISRPKEEASRKTRMVLIGCQPSATEAMLVEPALLKLGFADALGRELGLSWLVRSWIRLTLPSRRNGSSSQIADSAFCRTLKVLPKLSGAVTAEIGSADETGAIQVQTTSRAAPARAMPPPKTWLMAGTFRTAPSSPIPQLIRNALARRKPARHSRRRSRLMRSRRHGHSHERFRRARRPE